MWSSLSIKPPTFSCACASVNEGRTAKANAVKAGNLGCTANAATEPPQHLPVPPPPPPLPENIARNKTRQLARSRALHETEPASETQETLADENTGLLVGSPAARPAKRELMHPPPGNWQDPNAKKPCMPTLPDTPPGFLRAQPQVPTEIALELCAGHAGLSVQLAKVGFHAIGVDHKGNKRENVIPLVIIDLTTPEGQ